MIKVLFTSEDQNSKRKITVKMNSIKSYEKFVNEYKYIGGFNRFSSDLWGDIDKKESNRFMFIPANNRGFETVYKMLYGQSPYVINNK
ncbi:MAG TPA: hypothetical protein DC057_13445 [Spirochaetia bacterium]|nr:hypothetical protein [Spirochaetia bacterium]